MVVGEGGRDANESWSVFDRLYRFYVHLRREEREVPHVASAWTSAGVSLQAAKGLGFQIYSFDEFLELGRKNPSPAGKRLCGTPPMWSTAHLLGCPPYADILARTGPRW